MIVVCLLRGKEIRHKLRKRFLGGSQNSVYDLMLNKITIHIQQFWEMYYVTTIAVKEDPEKNTIYNDIKMNRIEKVAC